MATSDNYELQDDQIPVFLINGFLEAGKTEVIKYTMAQDPDRGHDPASPLRGG